MDSVYICFSYAAAVGPDGLPELGKESVLPLALVGSPGLPSARHLVSYSSVLFEAVGPAPSPTPCLPIPLWALGCISSVARGE